MRVLISGCYGFHNIGDEAILKSCITGDVVSEPVFVTTIVFEE